MKPQAKTLLLTVKEMTCQNCGYKIESCLKKLPGVYGVRARYDLEQVEITFAPDQVAKNQLVETIEQLGYPVEKAVPRAQIKTGASIRPTGRSSAASGHMKRTFVALTALIAIGYLLVRYQNLFSFFPEIDQSMGYGLILIVGLLTSFHCVAMCGGIGFAQSAAYTQAHSTSGLWQKLRPSLLYNGGRVLSYTLLGGIVGALGAVISFSIGTKGLISIAAGLFLVLMGINMLNLFKGLRKWMPGLPAPLKGLLFEGQTKNGPFYVGLLNGFMPCGPLQAMQLYALGTGSFVEGATAMFLFSLGTVPLMFGLGALSAWISGSFTKKLQFVSGLMVMVLGVVMAGRGLALSGVALPWSAPASLQIPPGTAHLVDGVQEVETKLNPYYYERLTVQQGVPLRWNIRVEEGSLTGCNNPIIIPSLKMVLDLKPGDNWVEFIPEKEGVIVYSCWMGMINSGIQVVEDLEEHLASQAKEQK